MPKYQVGVSRTQIHQTTIEIEAEDEEAAVSEAQKIAQADIDKADPTFDWDLQEDTIDVDSVEEEEET